MPVLPEATRAQARVAFVVLAAFAALAGCASIPFDEIDSRLRAADFNGLAELVSKSEGDYGSKARLLFHLDHAMALHLQGLYSQSNLQVEAASKLIDELYTTSLSGEAVAFLSNDMALPYEGENFERVGVHILGMLNYAMLGERDEALVEAKRVDQRLKETQAALGEGKVAYREDALARYLSALLYEEQGGQGRWDAYLDYKNCLRALEAYQRDYGLPLPRRIGQDLLRLSQGLGEREDARAFEARFGELNEAPLRETSGESAELVVLLFEGLAPAKASQWVELPIALEDGTRQFFKVAFPVFERSQEGGVEAAVVVGGKRRELELFQDWESIAVRDLQDRVGLMTLKAIARATAKFQAARAIQREAKKAGEAAELLAFLGTNIYGLASESADLRSWRSLPARVHLARLDLPPGRRKATLVLRRGGADELIDLGEVELKAGRKALLRYAVY